MIFMKQSKKTFLIKLTIIIKNHWSTKTMTKDPTFPHHNKNEKNRRHKTYTAKKLRFLKFY
jgi:hypothetical protein